MISQAERTVRHQILLRKFERLNQAGDPWMYRLSENDADIIIYITNFPREACSVYTWGDKKFWTSLSPTRIAGMVDGSFHQIFYEEITDVSIGSDENSLLVNETVFWAPVRIAPKFYDLITAVVGHVRNSGDPPTHS